MNGKKLLADLMNWPEKKIEQAITRRSRYYLVKKIDKDGSIRKTYAPDRELKKLQKRFLKYFLYRIPVGWKNLITGFRPGCSYVYNAKCHALADAKIVLRLDFANAFPTVETSYLKTILAKILSQEVEYHRKGDYPFHPLFPVKRVKWFRRAIKNYYQLDLFCDPDKIICEFLDLVLSFVTYQGRLPQGAPTSPYLFNIVLWYSGLIQKITAFLGEKRISVSVGNVFSGEVIFTAYADDLTISSSRSITKHEVNNLIDLIEQESPFRINREKICYFQADRIAPLVTGLRLVKLVKEGRELDVLMSKANLNSREKKNLKRKILNREGRWIVNSVSLPKKGIRKIRGLIHKATYAPPLIQRMLEQKIKGHLSCLKAIYGDKLPNQISKPYQKFQQSLRG